MRNQKSGLNFLISILLIISFHLVLGWIPQPENGKKRIEILNADLYSYDSRIIANAERLIGNVKFSHNNVIMYCDSAYSYRDSNMVDAFSNVHIIQGDTLNLYGDKIRYEGNNKLAKVRGHVKLIDKSITLTTDELDFDMKSNMGAYHTWGKIVDTANVLTSKIGRYYSNEDMAFFKDSVKVTNKDFVLTADTLKYNTKTERVFIVGPTHIVGTKKDGALYSEKGWYDTRTNVAELYKSSRIMGKEQSLQGDTIYYSKSAGTGRARGHVYLSDTTNHIGVSGRKGLYNEKTKIAFVTDSAIFMQFSPKDTLFMHADTLKSIPDLPKKEIAKQVASVKKIVKAVQDSLKKDTIPAPKLKIQANKDTILPPTPLAKIDSMPQPKFLAKIDSITEPKLLAKMDSINKSRKVVKIDSIAKAVPTIKKDSVSLSKIFSKKDSLTRPKLVAKKDSASNPKDSLEFSRLKIKKASLKTGQAADSISGAKDSIKNSSASKQEEKKDNKLFLAYHHVRFFKKDLQGQCDSLSYIMKDSIMKLFKDPVIWSDVHQLTAERIEYRPHKPDPSIVRMENNGFIISKEDTFKFNQLSGKTVIGYIYKNALRDIDINGNSRTIYYIKNKDRYSGLNKMESSKIKVTLKEGKIDEITFFPKPEGKGIPLKDLSAEDSKLQGFEWREDEKPKNRFDLYPIDEKRKKMQTPVKKSATK